MGTLLEELLTAASQAYAADPSSPSVTLSRIQREGKGVYYASVARYGKQYGEDKKVVCSSVASSAENVVRLLSEKWLLSGLGGKTYPSLQRRLAEETRQMHARLSKSQ